MTGETEVLNELQAWFAEHKASLADSGYVAELATSPPDRVKPSATVTIASTRRIGQLTVWSTGEAELSMGDADTGTVVEEHREITSRIGLHDATETLAYWVSEAG